MSVILASALAAVVGLSLAWLIVRRAGDGAWTDVVWTLSVGGISAAAALWPSIGAEPSRQVLTAALAGAWSIRLAGHLAWRTARSDTPDARYEAFKRKWGGWGLQAWLFLMIQAATVVVLVISIRSAAAFSSGGLGARDALALLIVAVAIAGEAVADRQMAAFRAAPGNRGKVADTGLWGWSRHPNYFFEWTFWLAWPVMALTVDQPVTWLTLLAPVQMWWLLNHVSGVPMLEAQMLQSRPDAYRTYQARVSRFIPLPPKSR